MPYLGNIPAEAYSTFDKQTITGDGGTSYTLDQPVGSAQEVAIFVNNVRQEPGVAYTVSGTALTMTGDVESSDDFYAIFIGKAVQTVKSPEQNNDGSYTFSDDVTIDGTLDINGNELILDADGDTSITADTDDQIDFKVGGSDEMHLTSTGLGLGTSSPSKTLHVYHPTTNKPALIESGDAFSLLEFKDSSTTNIPAIGADGNNIIIQTGSLGSERMRVDSSGKVGIAESSPNAGLHVRGVVGSHATMRLECQNDTTGFAHIIFSNDTDGDIGSVTQNAAGTVSYNTSSDYRLKENVVDLTGATERLKQISVHRFNFISKPDTTVDGFLAHEVQTVVPEAVTGTHNEVDDDSNPVYQGIDQAKLVPLLTAALQEAITKIEALETENADFETRIAALEAN